MDLNYHHNELDPKVNESTSLPAGEMVKIPAIWVIEAFTPSLINNLEIGAEKLGWITSNISLNDDFTDTVREMRSKSSANGWLNLGYISPTTGSKSLFSDRRAPLPTGISGIHASILQPFPSTTLLCCKFILEDSLARSLEEPLSEKFTTFSKKIGEQRYQILGVEHQKKQAVDLMLNYLHSLCTTWVKEYFPGYFSTATNSSTIPICDLMLFSNQEDFTELNYSYTNPHFLEMLDLGHSSDIWDCKDISNLYLQIKERKNQSPARAVLFGNTFKILNDKDLKIYGENKEQQIVNWLEYITHTLGTWVLSILAQDLVAEMGSTRDSYGSTELGSALNSELMKNLDARLLKFQRDAIPFAYDVNNYVKNKALFNHEVYPFKSYKKWRSDYLQLFDQINYQLATSATHILDTEQQIRFVAAQTGRMITANSNIKLATSNLTLQNRMVWMTVMILILTVLMAYKSLIELLTWIKTIGS